MKRDQRGGRVAAFFDLDGTLIGGPSLERRFFEELRYQGAIPLRNYFLWLARTAFPGAAIFCGIAIPARDPNAELFFVAGADGLARASWSSNDAAREQDVLAGRARRRGWISER